MAVEGLLLLDDGTVQVIGQPRSLTTFIPYLEQLTDRLREKEREEARQRLETISVEELREELERRQNKPALRTQELQEVE